jgi:dihydroxyacetone kinase
LAWLWRYDSLSLFIENWIHQIEALTQPTQSARAKGVDIEMLVVGDDAGVPRSRSGKVGRRGIAGTVLVQKIAGALAATGYVDHVNGACGN